MKRALVVAVAAACSRGGASGPAKGGIELTRVSREVNHEDGKDEHYLVTSWDVVIDKKLGNDESLSIRSACQVGAYRFFDDEPFSLDLRDRDEPEFHYGERSTIKEEPYLIHPLPGAPSMCELAMFRHGYLPAEHLDELGRFCAADDIKPGPCPPNPVHPPASGPAVTADQLTASISPARDPFPAALDLDYVFTAQSPPPPGSTVHVITSCAGLGADDRYHSDFSELHAGESLSEGQLWFQGNLPPAGTACDVIFLLAASVEERGAEFGHFCVTDLHVRRGAC